MPYKNIFIHNPAKISIKNGQLRIRNENDSIIPIEDITSMIVETSQCTITSYALSRLAAFNIVTIFCNEKGIPNGVLLPFGSHSRQLKMVNAQCSMSLPLKKQLWKQIVIDKITNQANCLKLFKRNEYEKMMALIKQVNSGDSGNIESVAAVLYFKSLFGRDFKRSDDNIFNAAMNYGYSIIRSLIARQIAALGFLPCMGIHHHSELNNFNLADDLIEPFRPLVDAYVAMRFSFDEAELMPEEKVGLYNLVNYEMCVDGLSYSVVTAVNEYIASFSSAVSAQDCAKLKSVRFKDLREKG